jgi:hypothetical protein
MVDNPHNNARGRAHVVCRWGGVIGKKRLATIIATSQIAGSTPFDEVHALAMS